MRAFNKLFGLGISRTGTTSLAAALNSLGIRTVHWPLTMEAICSHRGAVDITVSCRFQELDQLFPGSLFIYTERSADSWLTSVRRHYLALGDDLKLADGMKQFAQEADVSIYGTVRPIQCDFLSAYRRHHKSVTSYFRGQEHRMLRINIVRGDGWERLCPFLGLPILDIPFPHTNKMKSSADATHAALGVATAAPTERRADR